MAARDLAQQCSVCLASMEVLSSTSGSKNNNKKIARIANRNSVSFKENDKERKKKKLRKLTVMLSVAFAEHKFLC